MSGGVSAVSNVRWGRARDGVGSWVGGVSRFPFAANVDRKQEVPLSEKVSRGDGGGGTIGGGREADSILRSHPDAVSSLLCTREAVWTGEGGGSACVSSSQQERRVVVMVVQS